MSDNGSGVYSAPAASFPAVANTLIESAKYNAVINDLATALSNRICKDGQTTTTAVIPFASGIKTDTIAEKTSATGVTIDSVLCKDGSVTVGTSGQVSTDTISEKTAATGVTVDGVLLKDSAVNTDTINEKTAATGVTIDGVLLKDSKLGASYLDIDGATTLTAPATTDKVVIYDASAAGNRGITLSDLLKVINSLTEDTSPAVSSDFLLLYSTSGSGVKKVKPSNIAIFSKSYESANQTITAAGSLTLAHGLGVQPKLMSFALKCLTAEAGYSIGDEVAPLGGDQGSNKGFTCVPDATNLNIRFGSPASTFNAIHKTTGVDAALTNSSWALIARAWA